MARILEAIESNPVRTKIYPFLVLVVGYLLANGVIDSETSNFILAGLATIVGTVGIESARNSVTPYYGP